MSLSGSGPTPLVSQSTTATYSPASGVSKGTLAELKALASIIQSSVDSIEAAVNASAIVLPSSEAPFSLMSEVPYMVNPSIQAAGSLITSAAGQLMTLVRPAPLVILDVVMQFHVSTAIRTAVSTHVSEILRDVGPKGLHASEIAKPTGVHPAKLARALRLLATNHIFIEVSPDVFASNRLSGVLDTRKPVEELISNPESKFIGTQGMTSIIGHILDEGFKSSSYLTEVLVDPEFGHASAPNKAALNKAFKFDGDIWSWFEAPENRLRLARFGAAMTDLTNMAPADGILKGFAWETLPPDSLVVDVGGGVGSQSLTIARSHPHLRFVVQDREGVLVDANEYWKRNLPDALDSGRVKLLGLSFFDPQPAREEDVTVFLLRMILHDWADEYCLKILKHLRSAAGSNTRLVIVEQHIACACDEPATHEIPGAELPAPPKPLLPNMGRTGALAHATDAMMLGFFNGQERTITAMRALLDQAGWKLIAIRHDAPSVARFQTATAVPK